MSIKQCIEITAIVFLILILCCLCFRIMFKFKKGNCFSCQKETFINTKKTNDFETTVSTIVSKGSDKKVKFDSNIKVNIYPTGNCNNLNKTITVMPADKDGKVLNNIDIADNSTISNNISNISNISNSNSNFSSWSPSDDSSSMSSSVVSLENAKNDNISPNGSFDSYDSYGSISSNNFNENKPPVYLEHNNDNNNYNNMKVNDNNNKNDTNCNNIQGNRNEETSEDRDIQPFNLSNDATFEYVNKYTHQDNLNNQIELVSSRNDIDAYRDTYLDFGNFVNIPSGKDIDPVDKTTMQLNSLNNVKVSAAYDMLTQKDTNLDNQLQQIDMRQNNEQQLFFNTK